MDLSVQVITAVTGLVGAIGGVSISYLTLRHTFRKDRHTVKLVIANSTIVWPIPYTPKPKLQNDQLTFSIANVGAKDFMVVSVGIKIGHRTGGMYINDPIGTVKVPYKLMSDETCSFWTSYKDVVKKIEKPRLYNKIKIQGYVADYIGNKFYSNKLTIVIKETRRDKVFNWIGKQTKALLKLLWP